MVVSRPSLDLVVNGDLSITIDPGDREPRLFPHGESEELSEDDIAHYLNGVERWLAEQDGDDE